ncbi:unnamed protein product [Discosporangium mesarthrocarpum]
MVTFEDITNPGDVSLLIPYTEGLTGDGASLLTREVVKGSEAVGSAAKLSFLAPDFCSTSQVQLGTCGEPVEYYVVEWDTSDSFNSAGLATHFLDGEELLLQEQRITTIADSQISGTFQLSLNGETTSPINAEATAAELRSALEGLKGVTTIAVERELAVSEVQGVALNVTFGALQALCSNTTENYGDESCDYTFTACQAIMLEGVWYRVIDSFIADGSGEIPLAEEHDCSITASYQGTSMDELIPYMWANGYQWTVRFISYDGDLSVLSSPMHALFPSESAVLSIRGSDCNGCFYLPSSDGVSGTGTLTMGTPYYVRVSAYNSMGGSQLPTGSDDGVTAVTPNQVPFAPEDVSVTVVSGSKVEVFFCEPLVSSGDIWAFRVQWDASVDFSNATDTSTSSCSSVSYGSCVVTDSTIAGECPYSLLVGDLTEGETYYFRVAALGDVEPQQVNPTGDPLDNTNWSGTLEAVPIDQPPSSPGPVSLYVLDGYSLQVHFKMPSETGGTNITSYLIDVDTVSTFSSSSLTTITVDASEIGTLYYSGDLVYLITNLTAGVMYYVRVSAVSVVGSSDPTEASNHPMAPSQRPEVPEIMSAEAVLAPSTELNSQIHVSWIAPAEDGGSEIMGYRVEWYETYTTREEVQVVRITWDSGDQPSETFRLFFKGYSTNVGLDPDVSYLNMRDALMNINEDNDTFPIGHVEVERSAINGDEGYVYTIQFKDRDTNSGDQPMLVPSDTFTGTASMRVYEVSSGIRAGGAPEIQVVSITGTGSGDRNATNPDEAVTRGYWRAQFASSVFSVYISAGATPGEVQSALEGISSMGELSVSRTTNDGNGYDWAVTFLTPVGDRGALVVDDSFLWSTNGDAVAVVIDGDNEVSESTGALVCDECQVGETPVGYGYEDLLSDEFNYSISDLTPGAWYTVFVSALNRHGQGVRLEAEEGVVEVPLATPSAPTNVTVSTKGYNETVGDGIGDSQARFGWLFPRSIFDLRGSLTVQAIEPTYLESA